MAEIKPFRAWRYNPKLGKNIEALTSPLFDVVSEKQREALYKNPYNSIHISVPLGDNPSQYAGHTLNQWKERKILVQDPLPSIYVYYQYYKLHGDVKEYCRKGFIAHIRAYDWKEGEILRHENTIPSSVNDRTSLLTETQLHVSPTHGLYSDPTFELEKFMDQSILHPIYDTEDYQGVRDVLGVIQDAAIIRKFVDVIRGKKIILADGHHRYESSLAFKKKRMAQDPNHTGIEAYNYHLMYLTNTEGQGLRILPTHRIVKGLESFDPESFLKDIEQYFTIKPVDNVHDIGEIILGKKWAFGLLLKDRCFKIRLKPEVFQEMNWNFPELVKEMDLTVMHFFVFERILGVKRNAQRDSPYLHFTRDLFECITDVNTEKAQLALITQDITIDEVKNICYSGYMMPQKSTYFYPKVICGFLFSSIKEDEFQSPAYTCF